MDVSDVASTDGRRTGPRLQAIREIGLVNIADDAINEVAAPHIAIPIHGEGRFAGGTGFAPAGVVAKIPVEIRVHGEQAINFLRAVITGFALVRIDPEIDFGPERAAQFFDGVAVLTQADYADAVTDPG